MGRVKAAMGRQAGHGTTALRWTTQPSDARPGFDPPSGRPAGAAQPAILSRAVARPTAGPATGSRRPPARSRPVATTASKRPAAGSGAVAAADARRFASVTGRSRGGPSAVTRTASIRPFVASWTSAAFV